MLSPREKVPSEKRTLKGWEKTPEPGDQERTKRYKEKWECGS